MQLAYCVTATFPDEATRDEYAHWLEHGHLQGVIAGGATDAALLIPDDPPGRWRVHARYTFQSRDAFDRYVREAAPALRAEGLARFPPARGVSFERELAAIRVALSHVRPSDPVDSTPNP
ncbi:MAG: DUF4286 family protein [Phycisphaerales bacterium]